MKAGYRLPSWCVSGAKITVRYLWNRFGRGLRIQAPPCFIVGCGNSGTSILLAILGAHSRIYAVTYESHVGAHPATRRILRKFDFMAIAQGKRRWVEKTPKNIYQIDKLLACRPGAKVIVVIRDGRDVAASIKKRSGSLEKGIDRWIADNRAGEAHWGGPGVLVVRYEELIADFEGLMTRILAFLGEAYEPALRDYHATEKRYYADRVAKPERQEGHHREYRNWQINQPLFDGRGRWKSLSAREVELIKARMGKMLIDYGYARDLDW